MWRKSNDVNPSPQSSVSSVPSSAKLPDPVRPTAYNAPASPSPAAEPPSATLSSGASRLSSGLKINGEISGSSDLFIDGQAQGKIKVSGARVTVGPNGRVQSDIEAREIFVSGSVQGNLKAAEKVHVGSTGRLQGSVLAPRLGIDEGARLRGKVDMTRQGPVSEPAPREIPKSQQALEPELLKPVSAGVNGE